MGRLKGEGRESRRCGGQIGRQEMVQVDGEIVRDLNLVRIAVEVDCFRWQLVSHR